MLDFTYFCTDMYIKVQTRLKADASGKMHYAYYPRLYESYRNSDGRVRQHYLLPLNLDDLPSHKDRNTMCRVLNDMVGSGLAIQFEDTPVYHKALEVYHQLAAKGLLGQVRMTEEKPRTVSGSKPPSRSRGVSTSTGHTPFGVA